jgi:hypothetical protein
MQIWISALLMMSLPVGDPAYFSYNSPQCVLDHLSRFDPLPLMVVTEFPSCPWSSDDASLVEAARHMSEFSWWNYARTRNLEMAASRIDGTMLLPGEKFSFNEIVGERTLETGFKEAKVIDSHGYTKGVGGGICQTASTIHAAALRAGLEIVRRYPHRYRVKYMPPGLDATVDWGKKDLVIRNNTAFPVVFEIGRMKKGELLARIMAPKGSWRVRYKYEVLEEVPSDRVQFLELEEPKDLVKYYGRPAVRIAKTLHRINRRTGDKEDVKMRDDEYKGSPWTLRVEQIPEGFSRDQDGVKLSRINRLLKGTAYTVESARFSDIDRDQKQWLPRSYVNKRKFAKYYRRYSELFRQYKGSGEAVAKAE